jgi:multidrug efflux pump subunit AcrA (membrane-fusion protein)
VSGNGKKSSGARTVYGSIAAGASGNRGRRYAATSGGTKIDPSKLAKVEKGDLAKSVVATGKIEPITKVEIKSKASGIVKKLCVEYGDKVKKGPTARRTRTRRRSTLGWTRRTRSSKLPLPA